MCHKNSKRHRWTERKEEIDDDNSSEHGLPTHGATTTVDAGTTASSPNPKAFTIGSNSEGDVTTSVSTSSTVSYSTSSSTDVEGGDALSRKVSGPSWWSEATSARGAPEGPEGRRVERESSSSYY